jgi:hypothetical protein
MIKEKDMEHYDHAIDVTEAHENGNKAYCQDCEVQFDLAPKAEKLSITDAQKLLRQPLKTKGLK